MIHFSRCSPPPDFKHSSIWPSLRSAKNVKKQQEVSDLNQDYCSMCKNFPTMHYAYDHQLNFPPNLNYSMQFGESLMRLTDTAKTFDALLDQKSFFTTFSNFKHGHIKKFYWSSHIFLWSSHFFIIRGPRTDRFRGVWSQLTSVNKCSPRQSSQKDAGTSALSDVKFECPT